MGKSSARGRLLGASLLFLVSSGFVSLAEQAAPTASVRDGVYSDAQAARGGAIYGERCTTCHAARMWGSWEDKTVWDVFDVIKGFMPQDDPGSLNAQQVRDVVAYILKTNQLPPGPAELPSSEDALKGIRLERP